MAHIQLAYVRMGNGLQTIKISVCKQPDWGLGLIIGLGFEVSSGCGGGTTWRSVT